MRIMGLDFGSKTVGVAISDELLITAQGKEIIRRKEENKLRQIEITGQVVKQIYDEKTSPLVDYYAAKGVLRTEEVSEAINRLGNDVAEDILKDIM